MSNEEGTAAKPSQLSSEQVTQIQKGITEFLDTLDFKTLSFNFITPAELLQLYAQLSLTVLVLNAGQSLPVGFTVPIGGKSYRFQGTVTESAAHAGPQNDG
jgi:hypothetical protein